MYEWMKDIGEVCMLMMRKVLVKYFQNVQSFQNRDILVFFFQTTPIRRLRKKSLKYSEIETNKYREIAEICTNSSTLSQINYFFLFINSDHWIFFKCIKTYLVILSSLLFFLLHIFIHFSLIDN